MIFIWMILMTFTSHMAPLMTTKMIMNSNGDDDNENDDDGKLSLTITSHLALIIQKYYDDMNMKMMTMKMKILKVGEITSHIALSMHEWPSVCETEPSS